MKRLIALAVFTVFLLIVGVIGVWLRFGVNYLNLDVYGGTDNFHYISLHEQETGTGQKDFSGNFMAKGSYCPNGPPNYGFSDPEGDDLVNVQMARDLCTMDTPTTVAFHAQLYFPPGLYKAICNDTGCFTHTSFPVRPFSSVHLTTTCANGLCQVLCVDWRNLDQVPCP